MKRSLKWTLGIVIGLGVVAAVLWYTPTQDYVILPGVTENLNDTIQVANGQPPNGRLLMVAVTLEPANLFYEIYARVTPYGEIVPAADLTGPGGNTSNYQQETAVEMQASHEYAKVAALDFLGYHAKETGDGVQIFYTIPHMPASGKLSSGDVIVAVNGVQVTTAQAMTAYMQGHVTPGQSVTLTVKRHGRLMSITLKTAPNPSDPKTALIGVAIGTDHQNFSIPVPIRISTGDITGPSAGMMFGLEIISQLRPGWDLTHGGTIAGTGAIEPTGVVDPIGGIREKVITVYDAGAKVFLVPADNYKDALAEEQALGITSKMRLIKINTLADAVQALKHLTTAQAQ